MLKHHLAVSGEMLRVKNRKLDIVLTEKIQQLLLALDLLASAALRLAAMPI
jgi:hypothetical protein